MTSPKFHTQGGYLTSYALGCGYQELDERGEIITRLYSEHGAYHVRSHDHEKHERIAWDVFESLTEARKRYRELCRGAS